jgi:hypothetical protein
MPLIYIIKYKLMNSNTYKSFEKSVDITPTEYKSLCIPSVNMNIDKHTIHELFKELNIASIERIDEVFNYKLNTKRVFIHILEWYNNPKSDKFKSHIKNNGVINIIYNFPEFWKCYISTVDKIE